MHNDNNKLSHKTEHLEWGIRIETSTFTVKELGQYPTPNGVVGFMFDRALQYVSTKCPKILEPACGDGRFLKEAYKKTVSMPKHYEHALWRGHRPKNG